LREHNCAGIDQSLRRVNYEVNDFYSLRRAITGSTLIAFIIG
jgi:hypothetical protein